VRAYVGETSDWDRRLRAHRENWLWQLCQDIRPTYLLIREMPGSTREKRQRTESALARLLKRHGVSLLSHTTEEVCKAGGAVLAAFTPEQRRVHAQRTKLNPDQLRARGLAISAALQRQTKEQRRQRSRAAVLKRTHEQNVALGRRLAEFNARMTAADRRARTVASWRTRRSDSNQISLA
jgi:predicted GIY-YIG superfamily endonuclease